MLTAFFSDIHGNLPALLCAIADAKKRGVEKIYSAGDLVGYGPFPDQVCTLHVEEKITTISGNYDAKVLLLLNHSENVQKKMKPGKLRILTWTAGHISRDSAVFLSSLPEFHHETLPGGYSLLMVHGSPLSWEDTIYPSITKAALEGKLPMEHPDILICGHTHIPFVKRLGQTLVVNCGSTGQPVDGDPRPSYALLDIRKTGVRSARIIRFSYPVKKLIKALHDSSLPADLADNFQRGIKKREKP